MLPRVSAALAQFIAPIATSNKQGLPQQGKAFERFNPGKKKGQTPQGEGDQPQKAPIHAEQPGKEAKLAQVIQLPIKAPEKNSGAVIPAGISQALLQLMNLLHEQRTSLLRWLGNGIYQSAARTQKKNGRIRKGTVLDERAE